MMRQLLNQKGFSYILTSVMVLVTAGLFSVLVLYLSVIGQLNQQKRQTQRTMDNYLSKVSIEAFGELKDGGDFATRLDEDSIKSGMLDSLGLSPNEGGQKILVGTLASYIISNPTLTYDSSHGLRLDLNYEVTLRSRLFGTDFETPALHFGNTAVYTLKIQSKGNNS